METECDGLVGVDSVTFQGLCRGKGGLLAVWGWFSSSSWTRWIRRSFCCTSFIKVSSCITDLSVRVLTFFSSWHIVLRSWFLGSWVRWRRWWWWWVAAWWCACRWLQVCLKFRRWCDWPKLIRVFRWCLWCYAIYPAYNFGIWFLWFGSCWSWLFFLLLRLRVHVIQVKSYCLNWLSQVSLVLHSGRFSGAFSCPANPSGNDQCIICICCALSPYGVISFLKFDSTLWQYLWPWNDQVFWLITTVPLD